MARARTQTPQTLLPPFRAVTTRRTYEEAIEQIADAVQVGDILVGQRLPSERTLADLMGVSRPTVREAIKALADVGVLETRSGGGTIVVSDLIPAELLTARAELKISEVAGVLEARRLLEPQVAKLAALYIDDDDVRRIEATIDTLRTGADTRERFVLFELRFHLAIARATKNTTVMQLVRSLFRRLDIVRDMAMHEPEEAGRAIEIHERTLAAIRSGDTDQIDDAMDEHLSYLERLWADETGRARLRPIPDFLLPRSQRRLVDL
jgi:GntR family transcriptional repressor for pyruvate dehydrogenase complex